MWIYFYLFVIFDSILLVLEYNIRLMTVKIKYTIKMQWLLAPTQLLIQGQWWSIFNTHLLQAEQWWQRSGLNTLHIKQ